MNRRIVSVAEESSVTSTWLAFALGAMVFVARGLFAAARAEWRLAVFMALCAAGIGTLSYLLYRERSSLQRSRLVIDPETRTVTFENCTVENYRLVWSLTLTRRVSKLVCSFGEILAVHQYSHPGGRPSISVVTRRGTVGLSPLMTNLSEVQDALRAIAETTEDGPLRTRPWMAAIAAVLLLALFCGIVALIRAGLARLGWL